MIHTRVFSRSLTCLAFAALTPAADAALESAVARPVSWAAASAQTSTARITGTVTAEGGAPLADATITARSLATNTVRNARTSSTGFYALNDLLQYLGTFAFRPPVPAYRHSAAQFLKLRGRRARVLVRREGRGAASSSLPPGASEASAAASAGSDAPHRATGATPR